MSIEKLLSSTPEEGRIELVARLAIGKYAEDDCPSYFQALTRALKEEPPPFDASPYERLYEEASQDPRWLAVSLMTNAEREGDGATRLWSLAAFAPTLQMKEQLKQHAVDESRHALLYLSLLDLSFPSITDPNFRKELDQLSPGFSLSDDVAAIPGSPYAKPPTVDDFIQMNVAEIRTAIHHVMQRPAIAGHRPDSNKQRVDSIQSSLLRDELRHVAYTAVLIEAEAGSTDIAPIMLQRFRDFNAITRNELGHTVFDCSVECCEKHSWCRSKADVVLIDIEHK